MKKNFSYVHVNVDVLVLVNEAFMPDCSIFGNAIDNVADGEWIPGFA